MASRRTGQARPTKNITNMLPREATGASRKRHQGRCRRSGRRVPSTHCRAPGRLHGYAPLTAATLLRQRSSLWRTAAAAALQQAPSRRAPRGHASCCKPLLALLWRGDKQEHEGNYLSER